MFKFSKAWWCCLSDKSNQVPLTYCRILFYTRQLKFPLHIYLVLFFRFAHCSVGSPLTISNLQKRKINSSQSTNICVTALLEYQTKLLSPSMLLLLLIFMLWLLFFSVYVNVYDFEFRPYIKMNRFVCVMLFFAFYPSKLYSVFDNKAIKFVLWDKYCKAFDGIACSIAIIMCAYVNHKA